MGAAKITTDHEEIRAWVEQRGGAPAHVKGSGQDADPGILRIDFPGFAGEETLERMGWDEWFQAFEQNGLAFLHQDETDTGEESRFNKLVSRERIGSAVPEDREPPRPPPKRPSARRVRPS